MEQNKLDVNAVAVLLGVPVLTVTGLLQGDSPDVALYKPLAAALDVSERFISELYSAPSAARDTALDSLNVA